MINSSIKVAMVTVLALSAVLNTASAQSNLSEFREKVNNGTVGVMAGRADSAFTRISDDLGIALDDDNLRVLTILGKGSLRNIEDLLALRGVDIVLTQSDTLQFYKKVNAFPGIEKLVRYITRLTDEEFHLLAGTDIKSIQDLAGKKVNFGRSGTGTFLTSSVVFDHLGIDVEATSYPHRKALEMLKAGTIDAMGKVDGKPVDVIASASLDFGLHLVPLPVEALADIYESTSITHSDYPSLFGAPLDKIDTITVSSVMAAYNWAEGHPRRDRVNRFVAAMFDNIGELQNPDNGYDVKWLDVDLSKNVPGWKRHLAAVEWLVAAQ